MLTIKTLKARTGLAAALACALAISGCVSAARKTKKNTAPDKTKEAAQQDSEKAAVPAVEVTEASLRGAEFAQIPEVAAIYFDYDSATLSDAALAALKKNADYLKSHAELDFLISGYCDERGTIEYNLALGQKRAKEVREYYIRMGVSGESLATISYGKEQPICSASNDDCWAKNRRAETRARSRTPAPDGKASPADARPGSPAGPDAAP